MDSQSDDMNTDSDADELYQTDDMPKHSTSSHSSIFHRVTNTVSDLFTNVSWLSKGGRESKTVSGAQSLQQFQQIGPSTSQFHLDLHDSEGSERNVKPLYPEEGLVNVTRNKDDFRFDVTKAEANTFSPEVEFSFFQSSKPVVSSTPSLLPSVNKKRKNDLQLDDSSTPGPSTSGIQNGKLAFTDNNLGFSKKPLYSNQDLPSTSRFGQQDSAASPVTKKRIRGQHDVSDEIYDWRKEGGLFNLTSSKSLTGSTAAEASVRKRPRFSVSTYGNPLYGQPDNSSDPSLSIFYPGKVMYGGAFNYHRHLYRLANKKMTPRAQLQTSAPKTTKEMDDGGLSTAAKRILSCIDKISTPLSDSKRVYFSKQRDLGSPSSYIADFHKHRPSLKSSTEAGSPPVAKLLVPGKVKINQIIPSLLQSKSKQCDFNLSDDNSTIRGSLKNTALSYSEKANATSLNTKSPVVSASLRRSPLNAVATLSSLRSSSYEDTRSVTSKIPLTNRTPAVCESIEDALLMGKESMTTTEKGFTFSVPVALAVPTAISCDINKSDNKYSFRDPLEVENERESNCAPVNKDATWKKLPKESEDSKLNSVCNESSNKTAVCGENKSLPEKDQKSVTATKSNGFAAFLPPKGSWECQVCLLQNTESVSKCVACEIARSNSLHETTSQEMEKTSFITCNWGDTFKPPEGSWECSVCLLQNSASAPACIACQSSKPDTYSKNDIACSWGDKFKPPDGSWECEACLVRNTSLSDTCVACQQAKPGSKSGPCTQKPVETVNEGKMQSSFKFGFCPANGETNHFGTGVIRAKDEWECETCLVRNKNASRRCISCASPREKASSSIVSEALTGKFKFNTNSVSAPSSFSGSSPFSVGNSAEVSNFKGTNDVKISMSTQGVLKPNDSTTGFSFGVKPVESTSNIPFAFNKLDDKKVPAQSVLKQDVMTPSFSFGFNKLDDGKQLTLSTSTENAKTVNSSFVFTKPDDIKTPTHTSLNQTVSANFSDVNKLDSNKMPSQDAPKLNSAAIPVGFFKPDESKIPGDVTSKPSDANSKVTFGFKNANEVRVQSTSVSPKRAVNSAISNQFGSTVAEKTDKKDDNQPSLPFSFSSSNQTSASMFNFGTVPVKSPPSISGQNSSVDNSNKLSFPDKQMPSVESKFSFGNQPKTPENVTTAGVNSKKDSVLNANTISPNSIFSFGGKEMVSFGGANGNFKPSSNFAFGQNSLSTAPFSFGDKAKPLNANFSFGSSPAKIEASNSASSTLAAPASYTSAAKGAIATEKTSPGFPFTFGGSSTAASNFTFGGSNADDKKFSFNSSSGSTSTPLFQFGQRSEAAKSTSDTTESGLPISDNNPFSVLAASPPPSSSQKRVIRKAHRRNKLI